MILSVTIMIVAAALSICIFTIFNSSRTPVLSGRRWFLPGLGNILIVETLGASASFGKSYGKYVNVRYRTEDGTCGHCTKDDIRSTGRLLPYRQRSAKDVYIEKILSAAKRKQESDNWEPYNPPPGWVAGRAEGPIVDADIVDLSESSKDHTRPSRHQLAKIEKYRFLD